MKSMLYKAIYVISSLIIWFHDFNDTALRPPYKVFTQHVTL